MIHTMMHEYGLVRMPTRAASPVSPALLPSRARRRYTASFFTKMLIRLTRPLLYGVVVPFRYLRLPMGLAGTQRASDS
jgi:hypothetical protein